MYVVSLSFTLLLWTSASAQTLAQKPPVDDVLNNLCNAVRTAPIISAYF